MTRCNKGVTKRRFTASVYSLVKEWSRGVSVVKDVGLYDVVELPHHQDESARALKLAHDFPEFLTTVSGKVTKGDVEVDILFLKKMPCQLFPVSF